MTTKRDRTPVDVPWRRAPWGATAAILACSGCFSPSPLPLPPASPSLAPASSVALRPDVVFVGQIVEKDADPAPIVPPPPRLGPDDGALTLGPGRSIVEVAIPSDAHVSIGVFGSTDALLGFDVLPPEDLRSGVDQTLRTHRPLKEDSLLPRIVSFRSEADPVVLRVLVDASEPVELRRSASPWVVVAPLPKKGAPWKPFSIVGASGKLEPPIDSLPAPSLLVGLPAAASRDDGYFLESPGRYQFGRADVIAALVSAFRKTRLRFRRDPIAVADLSQWDSQRPATDLGLPRHISHEGGRDVDIALAASDDLPSTVRAHCTGVLVDERVQGCGPGTVRGFDAHRMAYLLGLLFETAPPVEKVFTDDAYVREVRRAAEALRDRHMLSDAAFEGLLNDQILRPSPWHTDHVHVRFAGPAATLRSAAGIGPAPLAAPQRASAQP